MTSAPPQQKGGLGSLNVFFVIVAIYKCATGGSSTEYAGSDKEACAHAHDPTEGSGWDSDYSSSTYIGTEGGARITVVTLGTRYDDSVASCSVEETPDGYKVR